MNTFCFCLFVLTEGVLVLLEDPFEVCDRLSFDTLTVVGIESSLSEFESELELDGSDPGSGSSRVRVLGLGSFLVSFLVSFDSFFFVLRDVRDLSSSDWSELADVSRSLQ